MIDNKRGIDARSLEEQRAHYMLQVQVSLTLQEPMFIEEEKKIHRVKGNDPNQ